MPKKNLLKEVLPGQWHGEIALDYTEKENETFPFFVGKVKISHPFFRINIIKMMIEEDLNFSGIAELRFAEFEGNFLRGDPTPYKEMILWENPRVRKSKINVLPVITKFSGCISEKNIFEEFTIDSEVKAKTVVYIAGKPPITNIDENPLFQTPFFLNPELTLPWKFQLKVDEKNEKTLIIDRKFKEIKLAGWLSFGPVCKKHDIVEIGKPLPPMIVSSGFKSKTTVLPNGTLIKTIRDILFVRTPEDGCVEIYITEYFKITSGHKTELEILSKAMLDGKADVLLKRGYIHVDIRREGKVHNFTTKDAIVKVESTEANFILEYLENNSTMLSVLDGKLDFSKKKGKKSTTLNRNQIAIIGLDGNPLVIGDITQDLKSLFYEGGD